MCDRQWDITRERNALWCHLEAIEGIKILYNILSCSVKQREKKLYIVKYVVMFQRSREGEKAWTRRICSHMWDKGDAGSIHAMFLLTPPQHCTSDPMCLFELSPSSSSKDHRGLAEACEHGTVNRVFLRERWHTVVDKQLLCCDNWDRSVVAFRHHDSIRPI